MPILALSPNRTGAHVDVDLARRGRRLLQHDRQVLFGNLLRRGDDEFAVRPNKGDPRKGVISVSAYQRRYP